MAASLAGAGARAFLIAQFGLSTPLLIIHIAVVAFVAQYLGVAAGLTATGASLALIVYELASGPDAITLALFAFLGAALSIFGGMRLRAAQSVTRVRYNLETAQHIAKIGSWESDLHGNLWWSPETYRMFGVPPGAPVRRDDFYAFVHPEDRERVRLAVRAALEMRVDYDIEHRIVRQSDGALRHVHQRGKVLFDGTTRLIGSTQDVTEARELTRELKHAQERLALKHEVARMGTFDWHVEEGRVVWSPEMERLYGISSETHEHTFDEWKSLVHPEDLAPTVSSMENAMARRQTTFDSTYRVRKPDGAIVWIHSRSRFDYDAGGRPVHMLGLNIDVTEMKRAAERVEQVNRMVALAMEAGNSGASTWNLQTGELRWTDGYRRVLGIEPGVEPSPDLFYAVVHPDDRARVRGAIEDAVHGRTSEIRMEFRIVRPDGVRWIERRGRVYTDAAGKPVELVGISTDITERKVLRGLLTTCSQCKKIRDEHEHWHPLETYIDTHSEARLSHGYCPECAEAWMKAEGL
jgi:PAS domain S-box-containing protein